MKDLPFKDKPVAMQSAAPGLLGGAPHAVSFAHVDDRSIDAQMFGKPEVFVGLADKQVRQEDRSN